MQKNSYKNLFLTLLVAESLIFTPSSFADTCTYTNDPDLTAQQTACKSDTSKIWDCKLNRCITSQAVINIRNEAQSCMNLPESTDAEKVAKKACMDNKAKELTGVQGGFTNKSNTLAKTAYGFSVGLALINSFGKDDNSSSCMSKSIFKAAAYGAIAGELYQYFFMKKALEKLQEEYKKGTLKEGAAFEAQVKAFEFLRDEQKAIADMAKKKQVLYTALSLAYGVATAAAVVEIAWPAMMTPCVGAASGSPKAPAGGGTSPAPKAGYNSTPSNILMAKSQVLKADTALNSFFVFQEQMDFLDNKGTTSPSVENYKQVAQAKVINEKHATTFKEVLALAFNATFPEAQAAGAASEFLPILLGAAGGAAAIKYGSSTFLQQLGNSKGIAVVSGICTFLSTSLSSEAGRTKEQATKNATTIEEIIAKFKADMAQFCPLAGDREDMNKPECFCYTSSNEKNTARVNSETCKKYWDWKEHNYAKAPTDYDALKITPQGCIDLSGKLDTNCACRKVTNTKTGTNGCLKSNLSSFNLGSLGSISGLSQAAQVLDGATQGALSGANVDSATLGKNAANTQKTLDSLLSQAASKGIQVPPVKDANYRDKFLSALTPAGLLEAAKSGAIGTNNNPSSLRPDIPAINEAVKRSGLPTSSDYEGGVGKGKKAANDTFTIPNIGGDSGGTGQAKVVEGFMEKERVFKDNDIVKDDGVPIWTILSNRYMTSGYRRLFEDGAKPEATPATSGAVKQ